MRFDEVLVPLRRERMVIFFVSDLLSRRFLIWWISVISLVKRVLLRFEDS